MTKTELIEELLHQPLSFTSEKLEQLIELGLEFNDLRECVRRIYDFSERLLLETSNASAGTLGKMNRKSSGKRQKKFFRKVERQKPGVEYQHIYAEGDSWFQFPFFIKDIIDWLNKRRDYLLYCEAYGGDWITNIIYEGQYIPSLTTYNPKFFLISGGGNDLVGNNRLAIMVKKDYNSPKFRHPEELTDPSLTNLQKNMIMTAQPFITKEFYAFIWVMKAQYLLLFTNLYRKGNKHKEVITITQGYDYPIPDPRRRFSFRYPLQPIVNGFVNSGQWLFRPAMLRGILNREHQQAILMAFIYEFNRMFISIARDQRFPKVYHIDCRDVAQSSKDWYDELHLKSHVFKRVAKAYNYVIDNYQNGIDKVIRVVDVA